MHRILPSARAAALSAVIASAGSLSAAVLAQNTPGGTTRDNSGLNGSLSREDLEKLGGDRRGVPPDVVQGTPETRAKVRAESEVLAKAMELPCEVRDAALVAAGTSRSAVGGKDLETRVYEVACANGLGFIVESRGSESPVSLSCFAAEAVRVADAAKGKTAGFYCRLPQNRDVKAMAATLMAGAGVSCAVRDNRWFGRSTSSPMEYSEIVCDDGKGFLLRTALPGSQAETSVVSCADAARQGIKCRLTDPGPLEPTVTQDTFKGALAKNGVSCRIDQLREVGQEDIHRRYVVEYLCADQRNAMVAFVPLAGNDNPFETMPCAAAVSRGVVCTLSPVK